MGKNALVLGGGGAKGAYEVGVFKALKKMKFKVDIITGASVGSLNGAIFAQGSLDLAEKMWREISTNKILDIDEEINGDGFDVYKKMFKHLFNNRGFNYTSLETLLRELIDEKKIRKSKVDFGLVTVGYPTLSPVEIFKEDIEEGKLIDYLLASAACFPAMKPKDIDGMKFIDGGYHNNLPIDLAIKKGATNVVAVDLEAIGVVKKYDKQSIKVIKSSKPLGDMLIFNKETAVRNIDLGYYDTLKAFDKLEGVDFNFKKGFTEKHFKKYYPKFITVVDNLKFDKKNKLLGVLQSEIKKKLKQRIGKEKPLQEEYLAKILEIALEILEFPMLKEYNFLTLIPKVKKAVSEISVDNIFSLTAKISEIKSTRLFMENVSELTDIIKAIDRKTFLKYVINLLDEQDNDTVNFLMMLGFIAPLEITCAIYLRCLYD